MTSADHNRLLIDKLSDTEKDELIVRLWRDLQEARTRYRDLEERLARLEHEAGSGGASPLLAKLQEASAPPPFHRRRYHGRPSTSIVLRRQHAT